MVSHYRELNVWQKAVDLVTEIYRITASFPKEELYGLTSQIRRSAVSLPSNIAEGAARDTTRDYLRFISIATGSAAELATQLTIANNLQFLASGELAQLMHKLNDIGKMLSGLQKSLNDRLNTNH